MVNYIMVYYIMVYYVMVLLHKGQFYVIMI